LKLETRRGQERRPRVQAVQITTIFQLEDLKNLEGKNLIVFEGEHSTHWGYCWEKELAVCLAKRAVSRSMGVAGKMKGRGQQCLE
jgi:hypothetical protein